MISKAKVKYLKSLQVKKYRIQEQCFLVEGEKSVLELLRSSFTTLWLAGSRQFIDQNDLQIRASRAEVCEATVDELSSLGSFQSNNSTVAIAEMKPNPTLTIDTNELALCLDAIRDPGNLGTIIRTADWYGIKKIIASEDTADFYNPKVLSATMGSFCRVEIQYTSLPDYLKLFHKPIYGTFLNGDDVHLIDFKRGGIIVIGNESNGISEDVEHRVTKRITIPRIGNAESLNAAIATGIILDVAARSKK
jgi:TrmH family RNA methyltransferase